MKRTHLMVCLTLVVGIVAVYGVADAAMPVVSNVQAEQRAGTTGAGTIVDITYDVEDADSDSAGISIEMSNDGGTTFDVPATTFTGDVGRVEVGVGKTVEWQAGVDVPGEYWDNCQAKVTAEDVSSGEIVVNLPGGATMTMVWIPAGTDTMGTTDEQKQWMVEQGMWENWMEREQPPHPVTITRGFYLGKFELTQGQWKAVMGTSPWAGQSNVQDSTHYPAVTISWEDMQALIDSLNTAEGAEVYRLPTEAESEYACRAGTTTLWSFGDDESLLGDYAWYYENASNAGETYGHAVGTKLPNPWGLHDMHGNVHEWVQDWYDANYYSVSPSVDPTGPTTGSIRVIRGGNFHGPAQYVRSAYRAGDSPDDRSLYIGARLLRQGP